MSEEKEIFTISTHLASFKTRTENKNLAHFMPISSLPRGGFKIRIGDNVPAYVARVFIDRIPDAFAFGERHIHIKHGTDLATVIQSIQFQLRQEGLLLRMIA